MPNPGYDPNLPYVLPSELNAIMKHGAFDEVQSPVIKAALSESGFEIMPLEIPVDELQYDVRRDPRVSYGRGRKCPVQSAEE